MKQVEISFDKDALKLYKNLINDDFSLANVFVQPNPIHKSKYDIKNISGRYEINIDGVRKGEKPTRYLFTRIAAELKKFKVHKDFRIFDTKQGDYVDKVVIKVKW